MSYLLAESWYPYLLVLDHVASHILRLLLPRDQEQLGIYSGRDMLSIENVYNSAKFR